MGLQQSDQFIFLIPEAVCSNEMLTCISTADVAPQSYVAVTLKASLQGRRNQRISG